MIVSPHAQRTVDWMIARSGIPTASEFSSIVTPLFKARTGEMPKTYLYKKIAEWWMGGPLSGFNIFDMDQGNTLEEEAIPWYELEHNVEIQRVGFITTDDGRVGCSPDGLIGDDCGIEIKCPAVHTHVGYVLAGTLPDEYAAQVHGAMYVTGRPSWKFLSYCRNFPPLLIHVLRDDKIQAQLHEALIDFLEAFELAKVKMQEANGGPPRRVVIPKPQYRESPSVFKSEMPT